MTAINDPSNDVAIVNSKSERRNLPGFNNEAKPRGLWIKSGIGVKTKYWYNSKLERGNGLQEND